MARRRGQRNGWLRADSGSWLLTYRVYLAGQKPKRITVTVGPSDGPGKLTEKQAERFAWDHYLKPLDDRVTKPLSTMTVDQYWTQKYKPWLEGFKKKSTQNQYISLYGKYIKPVIGEQRFHGVTPDTIEGMVASVLRAGKSHSTARHVRKVAGAIFAKAKKSQVAFGENPAWSSEVVPKQPRRKRTSLTPDQFFAFLEMLPGAAKCWYQPYREMVFTAAVTSMNAAELCGLRWENVNFANEHVMIDGEMVTPRSLAVLAHWKHGEYTSLKTANRQRIIPMPEELCRVLAEVKAASECTKPQHPVFCSREGTPIGADNVRARYLIPTAEKLGMGRVGWHSFRRTNATMTKAAGMDMQDRRQVLGHGSDAMVDHYTTLDLERTRAGLGEVARLLDRKERVM